MISTKIRIRLPIWFSIMSLLFCINLAFIPGGTLRVLRTIIMLFDLLIVFGNYRYRHGIRNPEIWIYIAVIILSGFVNRGFNDAFLQAIFYAGMILASYLIIGCAQIKYGEDELLNALGRVLIAVMTLVDFLIILRGVSGAHIDGRTDEFYYIGSKFTVSYLNMLLLAILMRGYKDKSKIPILCVSMVMIGICYMVDCMTGVTGVIVMIVLYILKNKVEEAITKPIVLTCAVILSGVFALVMQLVVELKPVQWFLLKIVNTDLELTGRANIFAILGRLFVNKPVLGYGYGNTIVKNTLGYGNPQNGLFDIGISYGIIGLIVFLVIVYIVSKSRKYRNEINQREYPILVFIYAMIVCGTVEINFSILFLIALSLYKNREVGA